jgi:hypothetical protein
MIELAFQSFLGAADSKCQHFIQNAVANLFGDTGYTY